MTEQLEINLDETTNPFKALQTKQSKGLTFDKNETFTLGGKEQSIYAYTQANREDTEIYECLEKYGCIDKITRPLNDLYGDASLMKDLRGTIEDANKKEQIWNKIPLNIRQKFGNDPDRFMNEGMEWAQNEMKKQAQEKQEAMNKENA